MSRAAYWTTTGFVALGFTVAGVAYLSRADAVIANVTELGYPAYFVPILGAFKLLGAAGILQTRFPRLVEWAYAGIAINLIGASLSHLAVGHPAVKVLIPLVLLTIAGTSWTLRRAAGLSQARELDTAHPAPAPSRGPAEAQAG